MITDINEKKYRKSIILDKRDCFDTVLNFCRDDKDDKIGILYGLRRTGKTTMIYQLMYELGKDNCQFIQCEKDDYISSLRFFLENNVIGQKKYVFIDEITKLKDFVATSSIFSDYYSGKIKIIISGTDSLALYLAKTGELYNRDHTFHMTKTTYGEFKRLMDKADIFKDKDSIGVDINSYMHYGGVLLDETNKKEEYVFYNRENASHYTNTAISDNITNSFFHENLPLSFRSKYYKIIPLHENNQLISAINRIVEIYSGYLISSDFTEEFKSHDLGSALQLLESKGIITGIEVEMCEEELNHIIAYHLQTYNHIDIDNGGVQQIKDYLFALEIMDSFDIHIHKDMKGQISDFVKKEDYIVQPGMRYCQIEGVIDAVKMVDAPWSNELQNKIKYDMKGKLLEVSVISDVKNILTDTAMYEIFQQRLYGDYDHEIDLVIRNTDSGEYYSFEIKHSMEKTEKQTIHLTDNYVQSVMNELYGKNKILSVLYMGKTDISGEIKYFNISEFLFELYRTKDIEKTIFMLSLSIKNGGGGGNNGEVHHTSNVKCEPEVISQNIMTPQNYFMDDFELDI